MKYTVFSETAKKTEHAEEKKKVFTGKKRRLSAADGFNKIDKALEAFMNYQQEADRRFWEAEKERERREEERDEKRRKEDQDSVFPQTDAGTQQVKSLLSHRFAPFIKTSKLFCNRT